MEKPCEICLKVVNPPLGQCENSIVCSGCAIEVYQGLDDKKGEDYTRSRSEDWFSFRRDCTGWFSNQVDRLLAQTCPQCRKKH
jgi:hypothetical protein